MECGTPTACGLGCDNCRTWYENDQMMSMTEAQFFTCVASDQPVDQACRLDACGSTAANCDDVDTNACEVPIATNVNNCGGCGVRCSPGRSCSNRQCACNGGNPCPLGQDCFMNGCRCQGNNQCAAGYICDAAINGGTCVRP